MQQRTKLVVTFSALALLVSGSGCSFSADSVKVGNKELGPVSYSVGDVSSTAKQVGETYLDGVALGRYSESDDLQAEATTFAPTDRIGIAGQAHNLKSGSKLTFVISNSQNNKDGYYELPVTSDFDKTPFYYSYKSKDSHGMPPDTYTFHVQVIGSDGKQIGSEITKNFTVK